MDFVHLFSSTTPMDFLQNAWIIRVILVFLLHMVRLSRLIYDFHSQITELYYMTCNLQLKIGDKEKESL